MPKLHVLCSHFLKSKMKTVVGIVANSGRQYLQSPYYAPGSFKYFTSINLTPRNGSYYHPNFPNKKLKHKEVR